MEVASACIPASEGETLSSLELGLRIDTQTPRDKTRNTSTNTNLNPHTMSLWDRYFAPGDLRARRQALAPPSIPTSTPSEAEQLSAIRPSTTSAAVERVDPARRARRQNALFFGGLGFAMLSAFVTRRSLIRKRPPFPTTFTPSNAPQPKAEGGLDAIEALGLATMNTVSVFMAAIGAGFIYWDIADIEDLRDKVRKGVGFDVYGGEMDADKEIEGWVAEVLARKDGYGNLKDEIVDKLMELEQKERAKEEAQAMLGVQRRN